MLKFKIIAEGTLSEKYWRDARDEYKKRMSGFSSVEETELKETAISQKPHEGEIAAALEAEAVRIRAEIPPRAVKIALCVEGKHYTSEALAELIEKYSSSGRSEFCFIIGSSHGLSPKLKQEADVRLSMSALTFPHQLARVMLYESLYRTSQILQGTKYHK